MANNTIGQFISVLRKANGMTQQQLADRLNVLNKAVSRVRTAKKGNELFDCAESNEIDSFDRTFGNYSFFIFMTIFGVILISVFLLYDLNITTLYFETVMTEAGLLTTDKIFRYDIFVIVLVLAAVYLYLKDIFVSRLTEKPIKFSFDKTELIMTAVQTAFVILGSIFFIIAPYGDISVNDVSPFSIAFNIVGLVCLFGNIISFAVFVVRNKENRKKLVFKGIRNCLFTVSGFLMSFVHSVSFTTYDEIITDSTVWEKCDEWSAGYLIIALLFAFGVVIVFKVTERIIENYKNKHETYCREDEKNV